MIFNILIPRELWLFEISRHLEFEDIINASRTHRAAREIFHKVIDNIRKDVNDPRNYIFEILWIDKEPKYMYLKKRQRELRTWMGHVDISENTCGFMQKVSVFSIMPRLYCGIIYGSHVKDYHTSSFNFECDGEGHVHVAINPKSSYIYVKLFKSGILFEYSGSAWKMIHSKKENIQYFGDLITHITKFLIIPFFHIMKIAPFDIKLNFSTRPVELLVGPEPISLPELSEQDKAHIIQKIKGFVNLK